MIIYVGRHNADIWVNKRLFMLDRSGFLILISGIPLDAFNKIGQLWSNPLYVGEPWRRMDMHSGYKELIVHLTCMMSFK